MNKDSLISLRIKRASECLKAAEVLVNKGFYDGSVDRAYFTMFHCMRALLAQDPPNYTYNQNSYFAVYRAFAENFVLTGKFDYKFLGMISFAFTVNNCCERDESFVLTEDGALDQVRHAGEFYGEVKKYLNI